jgi:hypothetical protein
LVRLVSGSKDGCNRDGFPHGHASGRRRNGDIRELRQGPGGGKNEIPGEGEKDKGSEQARSGLLKNAIKGENAFNNYQLIPHFPNH